MKRSVRISEPATDELTAAVRWYESRRPGLGAELLDAVTATIELAERQPEIGTAAYPNPQLRRILPSIASISVKSWLLRLLT